MCSERVARTKGPRTGALRVPGDPPPPGDIKTRQVKPNLAKLEAVTHIPQYPLFLTHRNIPFTAPHGHKPGNSILETQTASPVLEKSGNNASVFEMYHSTNLRISRQRSPPLPSAQRWARPRPPITANGGVGHDEDHHDPRGSTPSPYGATPPHPGAGRERRKTENPPRDSGSTSRVPTVPYGNQKGCSRCRCREAGGG